MSVEKCVNDINIDQQTGEFKILNDLVFGDYNPICCYHQRNCNLKCCKCVVSIDVVPYDQITESNEIRNDEVKYFVVETCGTTFKTKLKE